MYEVERQNPVACKIKQLFLEINCIIHLSCGRTALSDLWFIASYNFDGFFTCCEQYNGVLMSALPLA
jgi:hypothetical protein